MDTKHVVTQLIAAVAAFGAFVWAVHEARRDWAARRIPLVPGAFDRGALAVVVAALGVLAGAIYLVAAFRLLPRSHPLAFIGLLGSLGAAMTSSIIAALSRQLRRRAKGWLSIVGDNVLRVDTSEEQLTLRLVPGAVTLRFAAGEPQDVVFELRDGDKVARLWGAIPLRCMPLVQEGVPVPRHGLMIGGSTTALCNWLAPFIASPRR